MNYWFKCEKCNKKIKRDPNSIISRLICLKCRKKDKPITIKCRGCNELMPAYDKYGHKRFFCSVNCNTHYILEGNIFFSRVKYYSVFCPYINKEIKVQGSWEYKYALFLNEKNINWDKNKKYSIKYSLNDKEKIYYPDFYLPNTNEYVEIKGWWYVGSKEKMKLVVEQNEKIKISILQQKELIELGIKILDYK